jgi:hypothetical protein
MLRIACGANFETTNQPSLLDQIKHCGLDIFEVEIRTFMIGSRNLTLETWYQSLVWSSWKQAIKARLIHSLNAHPSKTEIWTGLSQQRELWNRFTSQGDLRLSKMYVTAPNGDSMSVRCFGSFACWHRASNPALVMIQLYSTWIVALSWLWDLVEFAESNVLQTTVLFSISLQRPLLPQFQFFRP